MSIRVVDFTTGYPARLQQALVVFVARVPWSRNIIHRFHHEKGDDQEAQIIEVILWSVPFGRLSIW